MGLRIRAFSIHLAGSLVLASLAMLWVFLVWYPAPLDKAIGVGNVFLVLLGVDVVIGPLLTLVVYKAGKPSLRFDLATIVCLQLSAFCYGFWTVAEGRPAWLVFNADRFDLVQVYQIDTRKLDSAEFEYRRPAWLGPQWVFAQRPVDNEQRNQIMFEAMFSGVDIAQRPEMYRPLAEAAELIRKHAQPLPGLDKFNPPATVAEILARWPEADAFLPMMAREHPVTVLINKASATVVAVVDLNPWQ